MPKTKTLFAAALFGASLASAGLAQAQTPPGAAGQPPAQHDMQHTMPMQGGMAQGGCPMMQRSAALERRVRQLEERLGILPVPPQPAQPGSPG